MPQPLPVSGICPLGTVPIPNADGSVSCWDPTEPGYPGPPSQGQKPEPNPGSPRGGAQPPAPFPAPTRPKPILGRQPGAPPIPYNPPGRIGLWPGPIFNFAPGGGTTATSSSASTIGGAILGEGPIFVDVQNQTNLADNSAANAVGAVADAVQSAITAAVAQSGQVAFNAQSAIVGALQGTTGAITAGLSTALGSLLEGVTGIVHGINNDLSGIGATIGSDIAMALNPAENALARIALIISQQIGGLAGSIAQAVALIIPEIVKAISDPIGAIKDVLIGVGNDITNQLRELTAIPGAIAAASTSLDSTLGRLLSGYESFIESQTGYPEGGSQHKDLSAIAEQLAGLFTSVIGKATPKFSDQIQTLCAGKDLDALLNKPWIPPDDSHGYFYNVWYMYSKLITSILVWAASIIPAIGKANQEVTQRLDQACPIDLLSPNTLVDAVIRGFLPYEQAVQEASKSNLNESRFTLLKDLATHQMNPAQLVEALYRNIVSEQDFAGALSAQGWTGGQQSIVKALGVSLLTVSEGLELLRRQAIDAPTLDKLFQSLAYDDAQRKALASLAFRPQNVNEATSGEASQRGLANLGLVNEPDIFTAPEFIQRAGSAEGLDFDATTARWLSHWNTGGLSAWVSLYFRSQITFQQLEAVAAREFVPASVLPALIDSQRPLVQFRTISTALRVGIIDEANARLLLAQHGYTQNNIDVLIAYAKRPGPAKAGKNAQALHSVSLAIAKEEYIDGSITGDQYLAILTQHGFTVDGANTELQVVNAHQALVRRKEEAQLVIDEFGAGLIDEAAALAQLAVLGLTVDELARAAHKIRAFRSKTAKHPSESDLNHFLQLSIISSDQYVAELKSQGYAERWAQAFLAWRQRPPAATSAGLQPSASAPGG